MTRLKNNITLALLFDLDGTLAETAPDLCGAMNYVLQQNKLNPAPTHHVRDMMGGGARMILQRGLAYNETIWPDEKLDEETEKLVSYYHQHIADETVLYDGVIDLLKIAKAKNIQLAIVTNKRHNLAESLLRALSIRDYFSVLIGGDDLPTRKPEPEMLLRAATRLGCPLENSIMIGDSEADTGAAKAANMKCLCVSFGYRSVSPEELGADGLVNHYSEIPKALSELNSDFAILTRSE